MHQRARLDPENVHQREQQDANDADQILRVEADVNAELQRADALAGPSQSRTGRRASSMVGEPSASSSS